jgi:hypothetical protein
MLPQEAAQKRKGRKRKSVCVANNHPSKSSSINNPAGESQNFNIVIQSEREKTVGNRCKGTSFKQTSPALSSSFYKAKKAF